MRAFYLLAALALAGCTAAPRTPTVPVSAAAQTQTLLPNGWKLTPAGRQIPLGDLPLNLIVAPGGKLAAATNNGYGPNSVLLLDAATGAVLDTAAVPAAWVGLAFGPGNKTLYASGGESNRIHCFRIDGQKLRADSSIVLGQPWPKQKVGVAGLAADGRRQRLYAVTREDSSLYTIDLRTRQVTQRTRLGSEAYTAVLAPDGRALYVSQWGAGTVSVYDPEEQQVVATIPVESHPNDMVLSRDGRRLFVANANSNSVSVIDTRQRRVTETLAAALFPQAPAGSTTNGVALSANEKQLFIANADNNCLAVFDVREVGASRSLGFIPTGWYPTAVRTVGRNLLITNGKGITSFPNGADGPNPTIRNNYRPTEYIGGLLRSTLSVLPAPDAAALAAYSAQVYANTPYSKTREQRPDVPAGNPVPRRVGEPSPIRHVFYIIKENRTYDQVLGDMPEGNGEKSLCLFGEDVTPNQHKLSREFVLLDNFYVDAEVSADGHNWSTAAYATDYVEKTWPGNYAGRGGSYDYEGARGPVAEPKDGFLWDYCQRAGISYRSYGEFVFGGKPTVKALQNHYCPGYAGFDMAIRDVDRELVWERDFDRLLAAGQVPSLNVLRLPNDHTSGARLGARTPLAFAADNDLAVGRLVEHLSKSSIWAQSVVMIVEDDAQNGPDHVDAHRSTAYLIGPHVRRHEVVHTMYSTSGMLRTLELILGLPPMSQYDAAATPLWACFTPTPDARPYAALPARVDLDAKNTAYNRPARAAERFNLAREDAAPDLLFNQNIWQAVRGENSVMPAPRRSAFVKVGEKEDD